MTGAPGHGKGYIDGLNTKDNQYLKKIAIMIESANEENYNIEKISMHSVRGEKHYSYAEECANFCRLDRSTSHKEYKVCNNSCKIVGRDYHVIDIDT